MMALYVLRLFFLRKIYVLKLPWEFWHGPHGPRAYAVMPTGLYLLISILII